MTPKQRQDEFVRDLAGAIFFLVCLALIFYTCNTRVLPSAKDEHSSTQTKEKP
jgi:TRAP-type mannitol/chloroaromatic compound transport system permease small subunit